MTSCSKHNHIQSTSLTKNVTERYADLVHNQYSTVNNELKALSNAIDKLISQPSQFHLDQAKHAWLMVRNSYAQTEAFRFYGGPIDTIEARINAWPIDESYIDYVEGSSNSGIINNDRELTQQYLIDLNEKLGESNISLGFHTIEFLLWGQDLYTDSAGKRPYHDYSTQSNAVKRAQYLRLVTDILIKDMHTLNWQWQRNSANYRHHFMQSSDNISHIVTGLGLFIRAELAGERLQVALDTIDQEDEQSCFSDNTHNDIYFNIVGIKNVLSDDNSKQGLIQLLESIDQTTSESLMKSLDKALSLAANIQPPFDQAISFEQQHSRDNIQNLIDELVHMSRLLSILKGKINA